MEVSISWQEPLDHNGIVLGYNVSVGVTGQLARSFAFNATTLSSMYTVPVLCRQYTLSVSAFTSAGMGPSFVQNFTATAPGMSTFLAASGKIMYGIISRSNCKKKFVIL